MKTALYLPVTAILLAAASFSCSKSEGAAADKKTASIDSTTHPLYVIKAQAVKNVLRLPAQFSAYEAVSIFPKVNGYIKKMNVDIGSVVKEGEIIMEMEAPEIEENELAAHERFLKAEAAYDASKDSYDRLLRASKTAGAVSPNDLETAHSTMLSDKALCNSENASWKATETLKDYLIVRAPFDGTITQRNIHPGALVTVGTKTDGVPMLELQQISRLRLQVKVPETYATQLNADQEVSFTVEALPGRLFTGKIARQANSLDEKYRSEAVEIDVMNPEKLFMPGMYAEILLPVAGHTNALVVPQSAVVTSTEKKYVVKVSGHLARIVDVTTGNENDGMIEVFGTLSANDSVIAAAGDNIKQGEYINY
ncbi:MAG TPA: efflux RND transporter periplasmic adaptor subunit [Bacteroidota bacterium]|nr:efflux RND transporter periplasmic adaptor subunit [Bacteroidota bacterium]